MKYIVLYIITIWLMVLPEAAAQKQVIDLLPSDHDYIHQEATIDTGSMRDTLVPVIPVKPTAKETARLIRKKEPPNTGLRPGIILNRVISTRLRTTRMLIFYITALKQ